MKLKWILGCLVIGLLSACNSDTTEKVSEKDEKSSYALIEWTELMPKADLDAIMNAPEIDHSGGEAPFSLANEQPTDVEAELLAKLEGKQTEAEIIEKVEGEKETSAAEERYQAALVSNAVRPEFEGRLVRVPGFVVPLGFNERQEVAEFFLVPYFGACIHVPPPPPNQIIHVVYPQGIRDHQLQEAFWVEGKLTIKDTVHNLGRSAYSMDADRVVLYTSEPDPLLPKGESNVTTN